jgi:hypothetical protein
MQRKGAQQGAQPQKAITTSQPEKPQTQPQAAAH